MSAAIYIYCERWYKPQSKTTSLSGNSCRGVGLVSVNRVSSQEIQVSCNWFLSTYL